MISEDVRRGVQQILEKLRDKGRGVPARAVVPEPAGARDAADPPSHSAPVRILIDGPSGSGKTTVAQVLGEVLGAPVYGSEYWAPGWEGLADGARMTEDLVAGRTPSYRRWDWETYGFAEEVAFDAEGPWIVEGCGALTPRSAPNADVTVWVEADPQVAKARGLGRDGETYAAHWDAWHRQEVDHWERNRPRDLADVIIRT